MAKNCYYVSRTISKEKSCEFINNKTYVAKQQLKLGAVNFV